MPEPGSVLDLVSRARDGLASSYLDAVRAGVVLPTCLLLDLRDPQAQHVARAVAAPGAEDPQVVVERIRAEDPTMTPVRHFVLPLTQAIDLVGRFAPAVAADLAGPIPPSHYPIIAIADGCTSLVACARPPGTMAARQMAAGAMAHN